MALLLERLNAAFREDPGIDEFLGIACTSGLERETSSDKEDQEDHRQFPKSKNLRYALVPAACPELFGAAGTEAQNLFSGRPSTTVSDDIIICNHLSLLGTMSRPRLLVWFCN